MGLSLILFSGCQKRVGDLGSWSVSLVSVKLPFQSLSLEIPSPHWCLDPVWGLEDEEGTLGETSNHCPLQVFCIPVAISCQGFFPATLLTGLAQ